MVTFVPSVWKEQGNVVSSAAESFYTDAYEVIISRALKANSTSPLDAAVVTGDAKFHNPWHVLIGSAKEGLTAVASKMVATGSDYAKTEEEAANTRFWE